MTAPHRTSFPFFSALDPDEAAALEAVCRARDFAEGEILVQEGESGDWMAFVVAGGVEVSKNGGASFLSMLGPGGFFGEMALFLPHCLRTATCRAQRATRCLILPRETFDAFCTQHPVAGNKILRGMLAVLAERLAATSGDLAMLMGAQVLDQARVSALIAKLDGDRRD